MSVPDDSRPADSGASRRELVRRIADEAVNRGRHDLLAQVLDERHLYHDASIESLVVGSEGPVRLLAAVARAFPDRYVVVEEVVAGADWLLARWSFAGTHSGQFGDAPATGRRVLVTGMHLMRFSAGRICQTHASWDVRGLERQLAPDPAGTPPPSTRNHRGAP